MADVRSCRTIPSASIRCWSVLTRTLVVLLTSALIGWGLLALTAPAAVATSAGITTVQSAKADFSIEKYGQQLDPCPFCGRLVCPIPDDLLSAPASDNAALPADPCAIWRVESLSRVPPPRFSVPLAKPFPAPFEPRGPPSQR
jgi:hypothetical protein